MQKTIVIVGASGNLGGKITSALIAKGAHIKAIVRNESDASKVAQLETNGAQVVRVDMSDKNAMAKHMVGAHSVISALAGLRETIIDTQRIVLNAAVEAGVKRFIPSDFSIDFTNLKVGGNRNLDLRREFHTIIDESLTAATSIFHGAFMELLTTDMPLILFKQKKILSWGSPDQKMEFTLTTDIANYTAKVALEDKSARYVRIAGDIVSSNDLVALLSRLTGTSFNLLKPGGIGLFNIMIKLTRFFSPGSTELYPAWQGMQYMRDMMEGKIDLSKNDNSVYPNMEWTTIESFLKKEKDL